jgi:hypothetical protein
MDLQGRLSALITAIGADIKTALNRAYDVHSVGQITGQSGFAADTVITGSVVTVPTGKIKVGTKYICRFEVTKTGAGVVAPQFTVRVGPNGTTADTLIGGGASNPFAAQTAVADEGFIDICFEFRTITGTQSTGIGWATMLHRLITTGLSTLSTFQRLGFTMATPGIDTTQANPKFSVSINAGTSASWTISCVDAAVLNLAP